MEAIEQLVAWAQANGVVMDGIGPRQLPGRGIGIVATRDLEANQVVLTVPTTLLRSLGNTPKPILGQLKGATVHAILATALCLDETPEFALWKAVFPTQQDVAASMPLSWPPDLQALLPAAAKALLDKQSAKFARDWALVSAAYPGLARDAFLYAWHLINSRTFYHTTRRTQTRRPREDHMVLQPVADLFNHAPDGPLCHVSFDEDRFTITAGGPCRRGDELFIRYGPHSNDFLLVEYGFILPGRLNRWDEMALDPYLCPLFTPRQRRTLEEAGFWGRYMLDSETACYRTHTALRLLCLSEPQWTAVLDGRRDEDEDAEAVAGELGRVLRSCETDVRSKLVELHRCAAAEEETADRLRQRWLQMKELVVASMARLQ
ncbi:hypothetical protein E4U42_005913 [Claviceps africana]|uniref:SET domain-containing protein n=1 Tax=Claviceps africana TaxID=83212 RepID=A0A8K0J3N1_9HYPO|nr:hypothetical protein E4U42_005913 [Claviceps africana]